MHRGRWRVGAWVSGGVVLLLALIVVAPFLYMVATSLMGGLETLRSPPAVLPGSPRWANYAEALTAMPFGRFFVNSAIFAGCVVVGQVLTSAAAAYAFARLRFPGRDRVFLAFLSVLMVPAVVLLIPRFLIIHALGWVDSYQGLIVTEMVSGWGLFLLRQFFQPIPRDLEVGAWMDGAGEWAIFWCVTLALREPALRS